MVLDVAHLDFEAIVLGAGVAGIHQIKTLVDLGVNAVAVDGADDVGGTWFNNRYPGARFDSESYTYGYSWSSELLEEWAWTERFSPQPETLRYLNHVVDKFDLRRHMRFGRRVESMHWSEEDHSWTLTFDDSEQLTTRFVFTGLGLLSVPTLPRIDGLDTFEGQSWHPFHWPHEPVDLSGKRVAILGTGATSIQIIPEIAPLVESLTVLQRRPNWAAPLHNSPIDDAEMADIRSRYDEIFARCAETAAGFIHGADSRSFWDVPAEERLAFWDELYEGSGFGIWLQNFPEIFFDEEANAEFSEYIANRIRERVDDPELAEKLIPRDHGFGVQRVPLETNYFETYNRDNVRLVDISHEPIERVTPTGIQTTDDEYDFDIIIWATGFDSFTGAYDRIDIRGANGTSLINKWNNGPITYLGLTNHGFPNLLMIPGPQAAVTNFPRAIESSVDWATALMEHCRSSGRTRFEAREEEEAAWFEEVKGYYERLLIGSSQHWMTGYNSNLDGHEFGNIRYNVYNGGGPRWQTAIDAVADGFETLDFA
jgi:cation diffusion facilitator CzcD-associated flavoprotein CzcO